MCKFLVFTDHRLPCKKPHYCTFTQTHMECSNAPEMNCTNSTRCKDTFLGAKLCPGKKIAGPGYIRCVRIFESPPPTPHFLHPCVRANLIPRPSSQKRYTVEPLNVDTLKSGHLLCTGHFIWQYKFTVFTRLEAWASIY